VFLPAASWYERDGHVSDWEGRSQRVRRLRTPPGIARPDWEILAGLAVAAGGDLGFETLDELHEERASLWSPREAAAVPAHVLETPAPDGLTLLTYPLLIDVGRLSEDATELKLALEEPAFAEIHRADADEIGLVDGLRAVIRTDAGEASLQVRVSEHVARGTVFVPWNQPGLAANTLMSGAWTTAVAIEAAEPVVVGQDAP
jgi:predicted molibdopterin-dependent oxidoreductase YjgC